MRTTLIVLGFALVLVFFFHHKARQENIVYPVSADTDKTEEAQKVGQVEPRPSEPVAMAAPEGDLAAPLVQPLEKRPDAWVKENPYWIDPFSRRKLDLPVPKSTAEILNTKTEFHQPKLPDVNPSRQGYDGSVLTDFKGYYRTTD